MVTKDICSRTFTGQPCLGICPVSGAGLEMGNQKMNQTVQVPKELTVTLS